MVTCAHENTSADRLRLPNETELKSTGTGEQHAIVPEHNLENRVRCADVDRDRTPAIELYAALRRSQDGIAAPVQRHQSPR